MMKKCLLINWTRFADLVVQKLKDKHEEEDDEEEPETTEAEVERKEKIDMNPKVEGQSTKNPHHSRTVWEEALRKVYEKSTQIDEPIPVIIKSVGQQRETKVQDCGIYQNDIPIISKRCYKVKEIHSRSRWTQTQESLYLILMDQENIWMEVHRYNIVVR